MIVLTPLKDVGGSGFGKFFHYHDLGDAIVDPDLLAAKFGETGESGANTGSNAVHVMIAQGRALRTGELTGGPAPRRGEIVLAGELGGLQGRNLACVNAEVVDGAILESAVAETVADQQWRLFLPVVGDVAGKLVAHDRRRGEASVEIDQGAFRLAGAIIGEDHVGPGLGGQRFARHDLERAAGPMAVEGEGDATVLEDEFVTAASGVGVSKAAVENDCAFGDCGRP